MVMANDLPLVHLPPEPVSVADVARAAFGIEFTNEVVAGRRPLRRTDETRGAVRRRRAIHAIEDRRARRHFRVRRDRAARECLTRRGSRSRTSPGSRTRTTRSPRFCVREGVDRCRDRADEVARRRRSMQPRSDIAEYRRSWEDRGLQIVSLQSLLFGRSDLQLFGDDGVRAALADYLRRVIDFGAPLGAHALVFGSPKNRLRGALDVWTPPRSPRHSSASSVSTRRLRASRSASRRIRRSTAVIS